MNWLAGMAIGALAMYIADPSEGRRRRALLQDKMTNYSARTQKMVGGKVRDARNRLSGLQAEAIAHDVGTPGQADRQPCARGTRALAHRARHAPARRDRGHGR